MFVENNIEVTILTGGKGRFVCTFTSAADAFLALNEYLVRDDRDCYFKGNMDDLMKALLDIRFGRMTASTCSMFELKAIPVEED